MPAPRRFGAVNWLGLWTLYRREVLRVLKDYRDTVLGPAVSSLLFLAVFHLALGAGRGPDGSNLVGGVSFLQFLAPGLIILAISQRAFETVAASLIFDKHEGIIADILMAPLTPAERMAGYAASAATAGLFTGLVVVVLLLFFVDLPVRAPAAIVFFALAGALLHALLGILVGLWAEKWDHYSASLTFLVIPLVFLSGTFYSVQQLPELGQSLVILNPIFYIIDGFRFGFTGQAESSLAVGAILLLLVDLCLGAVVYRLFATGFRVKP
ncbi:ABC transporter permease [Rhodospirillaceae bacterium SYSU D60014]|uniref:ABC transporter permease n=1 Tax=Virgifigura deserti TaxID=2268457 RepID=UPI000E671FFF